MLHLILALFYVFLGAQGSIARPLGMHAHGTRGLQSDAAQTSNADVQAQGASTVSAISFSKIVSDGDGNTVVTGEASASSEVEEGSASSSSSTSGYSALKLNDDGTTSYVVHSASATASLETDTPGSATTSVDGKANSKGPTGTSSHAASAQGTFTTSDGVHKVVVSETKP
eukprot:jgi/Picre1/31244/NNA_006598.t1